MQTLKLAATLIIIVCFLMFTEYLQRFQCDVGNIYKVEKHFAHRTGTLFNQPEKHAVRFQTSTSSALNAPCIKRQTALYTLNQVVGTRPPLV